MQHKMKIKYEVLDKIVKKKRKSRNTYGRLKKKKRQRRRGVREGKNHKLTL